MGTNNFLKTVGIAPNLLLKQIESTAPFLFKGEVETKADNRAYLEKLRFYKKNLNQLKNLDLPGYFHLCLSAHWATAGTFVPTDVDNQIRERLWKHKLSHKYLDKLANITIDSWKWDYIPVSHRRIACPSTGKVMATHEGTWLSVAIGAYCALKKANHPKTEEIQNCIEEEVEAELQFLTNLREKRNHLEFISATPLVAHNLGDLDRVMVQWDFLEDSFCQKYYKLGHENREDKHSLFVFGGKVNKAFTAKENHRHLSLRTAKSLRKSKDFLVHVGPFMDSWGEILGSSHKLNLEEKAEVITALYEGYSREEQAFGYIRGFAGMIKNIEGGFEAFEQYLPFDLYTSLKKSEFKKLSEIEREDFENQYKNELENFTCPETGFSF